MKAKHILRVITAASLALMVGCATNHMPTGNGPIDSAAVAPSQPVTSITVFMVTEDQEGRIEFEDSFSATMTSVGISTTASYPHLPTVAALEDDQAITALYQQADADSGLTIEVVEAQDSSAVKATKASGVVFWTALILDQPEIADISAITNAAAYDKARRYKLRLTLWDARSGNKLWGMDTESATTFGEVEKDARVLAEVVSKELRAKGLVL